MEENLLPENSTRAPVPAVKNHRDRVMVPPTVEASAAADSGLIEPSFFLLAKARLQGAIGHLTILPFCGAIAFVLRHVRKYHVEQHQEVRRQFREITKGGGPLVICSNHLTFIDSVIIIWALAHNLWYFFNYRFFSWNLPAGDFFKKKLRFRLVAYFSKCIFIHRDGSKEHKNEILGLCRYLIRKGETITVFPEGKRSRTGMFEHNGLTLGVGKIISDIPDVRVLCLYVRGHSQKTYANYPAKGDRFRIQMKMIKPTSQLVGKERYIDLVGQIGHTIKELENNYLRDQ